MTSPVPALPALHVPTAAELGQYTTALNALLAEVRVSGAYKSSDTSRASTATYANDPHLTVSVVANAVYGVELVGLYQAGGTGQFKVQFTYPTGATMEAASWDYDPGADEWAAVVGIPLSSPAQFVTGLMGTGGNVPFRLLATLHMGSTAGTLAFQWAQFASNATATIVRKGTRLTLTRYA